MAKSCPHAQKTGAKAAAPAPHSGRVLLSFLVKFGPLGVASRCHGVLSFFVRSDADV
jgi:hypothetical protein